jgi:hypothetical protein
MVSQMKLPIWTFAAGIALLSLDGTAFDAAKAETVPSIVLAQTAEPAPVQDDSLEARMARRFPQKVKVGDLIGLPILDDDDVTLGHVAQVVRSPEGKVKLVVTYSRWFGWFGRPVAVPIEAVAILAKQIASLEMPPAEYENAPTWTAGTDTPIPEGEIIRIALTRR